MIAGQNPQQPPLLTGRDGEEGPTHLGSNEIPRLIHQRITGSVNENKRTRGLFLAGNGWSWGCDAEREEGPFYKAIPRIFFGEVATLSYSSTKSEKRKTPIGSLPLHFFLSCYINIVRIEFCKMYEVWYLLTYNIYHESRPIMYSKI